MIKHIRHNGNIDDHHKILPIKQIYTWIYIKSKNSIIIVSKDGENRQMPGGKPKSGENAFETLQREIHEETSLKFDSNSIPILFGYYHIQENGEEYLQLRYFIKIEDVDEKGLRPNENGDIDSINYVKFYGVNKEKFVLHLKECEFRFNCGLGKEDMYAKCKKILKQYVKNF